MERRVQMLRDHKNLEHMTQVLNLLKSKLNPKFISIITGQRPF